MRVHVTDSGHVNRDQSAFPTLVRLDNAHLICGFSVGGGPEVTGGTDCARSVDGGRTWARAGTILAATKDPWTINDLRLSRTDDGVLLAYGERVYMTSERAAFGKDRNEPVVCRSLDGAQTWTAPEVIPTDIPGPFEITNPILALADGRWLAPAATLPHPRRFGERVIVFESDDQGKSWPLHRIVLQDPEGKKGFFEQKLIEMAPGHLMSVAWTVSLGDYLDDENHFALSHDGGNTWGPAHSTGIRGQTMTPLWLGGDRLLVVYNKRYGQQAVMMCIVRFTENSWHVEFEDVLWDAQATRDGPQAGADGIDEFHHIRFGLPSAVRLDGENLLAVHWCRENDIFGIRWTRLRLVDAPGDLSNSSSIL